MIKRAGAFACAVVAATLAGCTGGSSSTAPPSASTSSSRSLSPSTQLVPAPTQPTKWLCRPGMTANPCEGGLDATVVAANGSMSVERFRPAVNPGIDCFYVYPTVSKAPGANAPLASSPEVVAVARAQAARFAQVCRLYVPLYRQGTINALASGHLSDTELAYDDVLSAWHDYLLHDNDGRGVVLIGHSQGAILLRRLLQTDVESRPAVLARLVSAILPGTNLAVPPGADVGADLKRIPACRRADQIGCVTSWSTFAAAPPSNTLFGRVGGGRRVLCTNPAALGGGSAMLHPYLPTDRLVSAGLNDAVLPGNYTTGFVTEQGAVTATCEHIGGADVLLVGGQLDGHDMSSFDRLGPTWGLHALDMSIALGDLVSLVGTQATAFTHH